MTDRVVEEAVRIDRTVNEVFAAWTSGARLAAWFAPMGATPPDVEMQFEQGGKFRIVMDLGPGGIHITRGHFVEIVEHKLIRMSWQCDAWADPPSEVEVRFEADGQATIVKVRHRGITSPLAEEGQKFGWQACLAGLAAALSDSPDRTATTDQRP
ncbi:MAG: hypothetical protein GKS06_13535 [Acidobacteria bacterium]|nr:hypothetical protein [Acidobacteriota bacterium]